MRKIISNTSCLIALNRIVILKAKAQGIINSVDEILKALEDAGFRISMSLKKETLNIAKKGKI